MHPSRCQAQHQAPEARGGLWRLSQRFLVQPAAHPESHDAVTPLLSLAKEASTLNCHCTTQFCSVIFLDITVAKCKKASGTCCKVHQGTRAVPSESLIAILATWLQVQSYK